MTDSGCVQACYGTLRSEVIYVMYDSDGATAADMKN